MLKRVLRAPIEFVLTAHEGSAGFAADVTGRMTGVPVYIVEVIQGLALMVMLVFVLLTEYRIRLARPGASGARP
jgi:ABC-type uncharacterized transport system permease subunit